jgi:diguanylate cyclase (GGDEF)-like protein
VSHVSRAFEIARQHSAGEIFHACIAFAGVGLTTFILPGQQPTIWYPAIAFLFAVLCYFPLPIVMLRGRICGANIGDVAMLLGLAVGARGSMLPALFAGLIVATVLQVRRGVWPGRQALFINTMIMAQTAITPAMIQIMAPRSSHLERAMWIPLSLSYVVRGLYWPLMSLVVSDENRTRSAFVANLKGGFTVAIFVDLMTAAAALVVTTLVDQSPVALIPAAFIGIGVVLSTKSRRDTSESAARDELTGALNRRGFTAEFEHRIANQHSGSLLILDIDRFKNVNDELGHLAGDNVLRHLVTQATGVLPAESILGRLGGDEFAIVVFDADDIEPLVSQIRASVASPVDAMPGLQCAVSIGVSSFVSSDSLSDIMQRADHNMYEQKRARNGDIAIAAGSAALQPV